jgi:hypothetical protein
MVKCFGPVKAQPAAQRMEKSPLNVTRSPHANGRSCRVEHHDGVSPVPDPRRQTLNQQKEGLSKGDLNRKRPRQEQLVAGV